MGFIKVVTDHLPAAVRMPAVHINGDHRDLRVDACRGLALWFIFIDHIPDNALTWLTLRNYGFSDTSEVFVFVSGYTCMLAYGGALREQGWPTIAARAARRCWEIYAAFLLLLIIYVAMVWVIGGRNRTHGIGRTLPHGSTAQLVYAGLANWRDVLQSGRLATAVRLGGLVCLRW